MAKVVKPLHPRETSGSLVLWLQEWWACEQAGVTASLEAVGSSVSLIHQLGLYQQEVVEL